MVVVTFLQASFAAEARRIATAVNGISGVVIFGHLVPLPFFAAFCFLAAATSFRADGLPIVGNTEGEQARNRK